MSGIILRHNLEARRFQWLWAKYVTGVNDAHHCTNCLRGTYSKAFSAHNPCLEGQALRLDEPQRRPWLAIYLCGVVRHGYPRSNYPHNLHAVLLPEAGHTDTWSFECWTLEVQNARFELIPGADMLPANYRSLPPPFTTCRIFRWAVIAGLPRFAL